MLSTKDFRVGGLITRENDEKYRILEIFVEENRKYIFCCSIKKPIKPIIFECRDNGDKIQIKEEKDKEKLEKFYKKISFEKLEDES